ncbi:MAG TPA: Holliday junction resolvase RuvX [Clostridiales bacterium]|nr:Holliday junction resolvase RuvX [Clostridiales bacterium]
MIIMSVDLGAARTGIAVSDKNEGFAFPKAVIHERDRSALIDKICEKAKELSAEMVVVGFPKNMDGTAGFKAEECAAIARDIGTKSGLPVELWDERCTTLSAHTLLNYTDTRGKKRKDIIDAVAATLILEDFLRHRKTSCD